MLIIQVIKLICVSKHHDLLLIMIIPTVALPVLSTVSSARKCSLKRAECVLWTPLPIGIFSIVVAGNTTYKSLCRPVGPSHLAFFVCLSITLSSFFFAFFSCSEVEMFRYECSRDGNAPTQIVTAHVQPPATGAAV